MDENKYSVTFLNGNSIQFKLRGFEERVEQDVAELFNSEKYSDVHFMVCDDVSAKRIPAHRFLLSIKSPVFNKMFGEALARHPEDIEIPEISPAAFLAFLRFLYTDVVEITPDTVLHILTVAEKYSVRSLKCECSKFMRESLTCENVFTLLITATVFEDIPLKKACLCFIDFNPQSFEAESFLKINAESLFEVISRNILLTEIDLFRIIIKWSGSECQRRQLPLTVDNRIRILGKTWRFVRFSLISVWELSEMVSSGFLTDSEMTSFFQHIIKSGRHEPLPEFLCSRCQKLEFSVNRFKGINCMEYDRVYPPFYVDFTVNRPIYLRGYVFFDSEGGRLSSRWTDKSITLLEGSQVCRNVGIVSKRNDESHTFEVRYGDEILLKKNHRYTVIFNIKEKVSGLMYYGIRRRRKVEVKTPLGSIRFKFLESDRQEDVPYIQDSQMPKLIFIL